MRARQIQYDPTIADGYVRYACLGLWRCLVVNVMTCVGWCARVCVPTPQSTVPITLGLSGENSVTLLWLKGRIEPEPDITWIHHSDWETRQRELLSIGDRKNEPAVFTLLAKMTNYTLLRLARWQGGEIALNCLLLLLLLLPPFGFSPLGVHTVDSLNLHIWFSTGF